jgi:hypothetical protein
METTLEPHVDQIRIYLRKKKQIQKIIKLQIIH